MLCESVHQLDCQCLSCWDEYQIETGIPQDKKQEQIAKEGISQHTQSCANLTLLDMSKCSCDNTDEWEDLPF